MDPYHMISSAAHRSLFLMTALLLSLIISTPAHAQRNKNVSSAEDVAIAFFKAGGTNPDFEGWAKASRDYKTASATRAGEALSDEKQRLFKKWRAFNPDESLLTVSSDINLELKAVVTKEGEESFWMYMIFPHGDVTYFPYKFLEYDFAIIPQQIETMMIQPLQKQQYELFIQTFGGERKRSATLSLQLKPVRAYMQQPYLIDNKDQWILLCDIATMSLSVDKSGHPIWTYGSDWYVSPVTQELRELYSKPGESSGP